MAGLAYATVFSLPFSNLVGHLYANTLVVVLMKLAAMHVPQFFYTAYVVTMTWQVGGGWGGYRSMFYQVGGGGVYIGRCRYHVLGGGWGVHRSIL